MNEHAQARNDDARRNHYGEFFENQFNQSTQDPTLFLLTHAC